MQIIGFNLSKILIERKDKLPQQMQISQNINIKEVSKEKIPFSGEEVIKMAFNFTISYPEDSAKLEFEGNIILLPDPEQFKTFLKEWKDKNIPENVRIPLFNFIMNKCNIKALSLEDELNLPYHLPLPRVNPETNNAEDSKKSK